MNQNNKMENISYLVSNCKKCDLYKTRNKPVVGDGSEDADIMFIGEAPGYNEDMQGIPFVGKAGRILDELLDSVELKREEIYIANILKCRPEENRNPSKDEIENCSVYLNKQIEIIQPKIIVPLGNFACKFIFEKFGLKYDNISKIHGKAYKIKTIFEEIIILPMFHPAVATYNPNTKHILIEDFKNIKKLLQKTKL